MQNEVDIAYVEDVSWHLLPESVGYHANVSQNILGFMDQTCKQDLSNMKQSSNPSAARNNISFDISIARIERILHCFGL
jgi:hypothetical protein